MPDGASPASGGADRWPAWFALAAFVLALGAALVLGGLLFAVAGVVAPGVGDDAPGLAIGATLLQDVAFVAVVVALAASVSRPTPGDFGLVPVPLGRAALQTSVVALGFYAFVAVYTIAVRPEGEQDVLDTLGADEGLGLLVVSGLIVVVLAPFAEEILFRGFMYRALRNRLPVIAAAAVIGAVFGSIHFSGADTLDLLPILAVLGAAFCLLREWSGSLYPPIALHAVNNGIALAGTADAAGALAVAAGSLAVALASCLVLPRALGSQAPREP
jgi:uncharacterized protein